MDWFTHTNTVLCKPVIILIGMCNLNVNANAYFDIENSETDFWYDFGNTDDDTHTLSQTSFNFYMIFYAAKLLENPNEKCLHVRLKIMNKFLNWLKFVLSLIKNHWIDFWILFNSIVSKTRYPLFPIHVYENTRSEEHETL